MNKTIFTISLMALILLAQSNAFAHQKFEKKFQQRLFKQSHYIEKGFYNGDFSYHELKKLFKTQLDLQRLSREFKKNDHYDHKEKKLLTNRLEKFADMIDQMRHNNKKYDYDQQRDMNRRQHKWRHNL